MEGNVYQEDGYVYFLSIDYRLVINLEGAFRRMSVSDFRKMFSVIYHLGPDWYDFYTLCAIWELFLQTSRETPRRNKFLAVVRRNYDKIPGWWYLENCPDD